MHKGRQHGMGMIYQLSTKFFFHWSKYTLITCNVIAKKFEMVKIINQSKKFHCTKVQFHLNENCVSCHLYVVNDTTHNWLLKGKNTGQQSDILVHRLHKPLQNHNKSSQIYRNLLWQYQTYSRHKYGNLSEAKEHHCQLRGRSEE